MQSGTCKNSAIERAHLFPALEKYDATIEVMVFMHQPHLLHIATDAVS